MNRTETCPNCGQATENIIECPRCHTEGCIEFCIPAGVGTICAKCEENED